MANPVGRQAYPDWFLKLVEKWRLRLIPEWKVIVVRDPPIEDAERIEDHIPEARSRSNACYKIHRIWVNLSHPLNNTRRATEESLVHELLHAPFAGIEDAYAPAMQHLDRFQHSLVERAVEAEMERMIEHQSRTLVALEHGDSPVTLEVRNG